MVFPRGFNLRGRDFAGEDMKINLGFCKGSQQLNISDKHNIKVLVPNAVEAGLTGAEEVLRALEDPTGSERLRDIVLPGERIVIITSDITRPMPSKVVVPLVVEEIEKAGVSRKDISVVFALGSHREHTQEEMRYLVGDDIFDTVRCIDADAEHCIHLGVSKAGTPFDVFDEVVNADRRICLGNVEYHYFAGYSGGAKAIMPGVSTRGAIQANHSMMVDENSCTGKLDGNPVREDIDDVANFVNIDFIVNVVLDEHKKIVHAQAGHYIKAHRKACEYLDKMYMVGIENKADVVIVSAGGYPKDLNLYQAQKALDNAKHAVKKGGTIILVASCKEGLGEETFERWMTSSESPQFMVEEIQRNFELGGHKAAAIAMVLGDADVVLVSDLDDDFVKSIFLKPIKDVQSAFDSLESKGTLDVIVMPYGGSTLPKVF